MHRHHLTPTLRPRTTYHLRWSTTHHLSTAITTLRFHMRTIGPTTIGLATGIGIGHGRMADTVDTGGAGSSRRYGGSRLGFLPKRGVWRQRARSGRVVNSAKAQNRGGRSKAAHSIKVATASTMQ